MKRYRLKKDLPTFNAGEIFILSGLDGCLWHSDDGEHADNIMAYHRRTLEKFSNILEDWFEEIDEDAELRKRIESLEFRMSFLESEYKRLKQTEE